MARTIQEVQNEILASVAGDATLSEMNSSSATALYRLFARVAAKAIVTLENLYDLFRGEMNDALANQKAHTLSWYRTKALDFQLGFDLVEGQDVYDNSGVDPDEVSDSKVVNFASVVERDGTLIIKVNTRVSGQPAVLWAEAYDAFEAYMREVKDAGVRMEIRNAQADKIILEVDVYYDATVLGVDGSRLDGSDDNPVGNAITDFLRFGLTPQGRFVKSYLVDQLQAIEGVVVPVVRNAQATRFDSASFVMVDIDYEAFSGFLRLYDDADLTLNFIPYV